MLLFHGCSLLQAIDLLQFPSVLMRECAQQQQQQKQRQSGALRWGELFDSCTWAREALQTMACAWTQRLRSTRNAFNAAFNTEGLACLHASPKTTSTASTISHKLRKSLFSAGNWPQLL